MSNVTLERFVNIVAGRTDLEACKAFDDAMTPPVNSMGGTMRKWMTGRNGRKITTIQVGDFTVWAPTGRVIDAKSYAGKVLLNGSAREYAGLKVLHADDRVLIVDGKHETIGYYLEDED